MFCYTQVYVQVFNFVATMVSAHPDLQYAILSKIAVMVVTNQDVITYVSLKKKGTYSYSMLPEFCQCGRHACILVISNHVNILYTCSYV